MKKIIILTLSLIYSFGLVIVNNPNDTITIGISKTSVNRLVLPAKILDVTYSKEKGLTIKVVGNQAFLKYAPTKQQEFENINNQMKPTGKVKIVYDNAKTSEVYFVTEDKTYSFVFVPKKKKAETIIVNDLLANKQKVLKYETEDNYVSNLSKLTKSVLDNHPPFGYKLKEINKVVYKDNLFTTTYKTLYKGVLYNVNLYEVSYRGKKPIRLNIKNLYNLSKTTPKAISVYYGNKYNYLFSYGTAKVVIVEGNSNVR